MHKILPALFCALLVSLAAAVSLAEIAPGTAAPDFTLKDTEGQAHHLQDYLKAGHTVVLEWFNPDCPFIRKHHQAAPTMNNTFAAVQEQGVVWLAINSSAAGQQGHGLERNRKAHAEYEMNCPILLDEEGLVGRAYGAKTTPHMFVINPAGVVMYNGAIDDNPSPTTLGETNHVAQALQAVLKGEAVAEASTRPYGCSVKYAKGK